MLTRPTARVTALLVTTTCLVALGWGAASPTYAECTATPTGEVECDAGTPGDNGGEGDDPGGSSSCTVRGEDIPCTDDHGAWWSSTHGCYIGNAFPPGELTPPQGQSQQDGAWHICYWPPPGSSWDPVWIEAGEVTVDPAVLAQRAVASMDLDPITIGIVPESGPDRVGIIGLPVWMWVDDARPNTYGPITATASEGSVSVTATANVASIDWDMGDGTTITCTGAGTRYEDRYGDSDSPTCGHRYQRMSYRQPGGAYTVTATSHWVVQWTGGGQSGTIDLDLTTPGLPVRVAELQVLVQ